MYSSVSSAEAGREKMKDQEFKKICIQYIIAMAWVDGKFYEVERDFLVSLIQRAQFEPATRAEVDRWLTQAPPEPNWETIKSQPAIAKDVLRQAMLLAMLDMTVTANEMALLQKLRTQLEMSEQDFWALQSEVEQIIAAQLGAG